MKWPRKVLIGLCSLVLLIILLNIGLNLWIKYQLPKIINKENDSAYFITYKKLEVSLLHSNILVKNVVVVPKTALRDSLNKAGLYAKVDAVRVADFKIWDVIFSDKIKARSITIEKPNVILYKRKPRYDVKEEVVGPFEKIISVSDIYVKNGNVSIVSGKNNTPILGAKNIDFQLEGLLITEKTLSEKIPFHCQSYTMTCDSLDYFPNQFYHIKSDKIKATKTDLTMDRFAMLPRFSRRQFVTAIPKEKDLNTILAKSVKISKMDWGFNKDDFYFHCNLVDLNQVNANVYRSKEPEDDLSKKNLYNKLLRELKFDMKIDTLKLHNSMVAYEEEKSFEFGAGKVSFSRFNATVTNICSGFKKTTLPDLKIRANCLFMNVSPLSVDWRFNVMDKSDGFTIKGILTNFDAENMVRFTKPYMNLAVTGVMDKVQFNFTGNDQKSEGEFAVEYDDLKFTIFQKDNREKKNKFLTFVAKVFVKKSTKEKVKEAHIEIERIPEKSFYNLLWRSVAEGLKKILI